MFHTARGVHENNVQTTLHAEMKPSVFCVENIRATLCAGTKTSVLWVEFVVILCKTCVHPFGGVMVSTFAAFDGSSVATAGLRSFSMSAAERMKTN